VLNQQGPRPTGELPINRALSLLPSRLVRCAQCCCAVEETCPQKVEDGKKFTFTPLQDQTLVHLLCDGRSEEIICKQLREIIAYETGQDYDVSVYRIRHRRHKLKLTGGREEDLHRVDSFWNDPFADRQGVWHLTCTCLSAWTKE